MTHRSNIMNHFKLSYPRVAGLPYPRSGGATETKGFTLVELIVVVAILGILVLMAVPSYNKYINRAKNARAISEVRTLRNEISAYTSDNGGTNPVDLVEIKRGGLLDPWNREYQYNNFFDLTAKPPLKDLIDPRPFNDTFDVYSLGEDGESAPIDNGSTTIDDIISTNDGAFVGLRDN
jgi:general secretion pathway protein G